MLVYVFVYVQIYNLYFHPFPIQGKDSRLFKSIYPNQVYMSLVVLCFFYLNRKLFFKQKNNAFWFTHTFTTFMVLYSPLYLQLSNQGHSSSAWKHPLAFLSLKFLWWWSLSVFSCLKSLIFDACGILVWQLVSFFQHLKYSLSCLRVLLLLLKN